MNRLLGCVALILASLVLTPSGVLAQVVGPGYRRPYPTPYYPNPYYAGSGTGAAYAGYGNMLSGAADLNRANNEYMVQYEQARLMREQSNQAKIDTKKKAFDQMLYEKANTPTYLETLTQEKQQQLARMMNYPVRTEITDGKTLNVMLPLLQSLTLYGAQGQPIPLSPQNVSALNVSGSGGSGAGGSVGMLRSGGIVDWPVALRGPQQKKLDSLLPAAVSATAAGTLNSKMMKQIRTELKTMREIMREQLRKEEIETSSYLQAIEFYNALESSVNALERPDARKQLDGSFAARGRNVQELVEYMTDSGLLFTPASPGSENAYRAVHDAFVRYARIAQNSSGFQASRASLAPIAKK